MSKDKIPTLNHAKPLPVGFAWCGNCQAMREDWHRHGDPLEAMDRAQLLERLRAVCPSCLQCMVSENVLKPRVKNGR